jgi:hypothetical protein
MLLLNLIKIYSQIHRLRLTLSKRPKKVDVFPHLKKETDPVYETVCFLVIKIRTMDKAQKPSDSECYTSSSEPFRFTKKACGNFEIHIGKMCTKPQHQIPKTKLGTLWADAAEIKKVHFFVKYYILDACLQMWPIIAGGLLARIDIC